MNKPKALQPGSTIGVVSPASAVDRETLAPGIKLFEDRGYKLKFFPHAFDSTHYLAGSDKDRASDLTAAFNDPECDAVLCSRGGYGCARLLEHLDLPALAATEKMFIGFSDVTTLHLAFNQLGLVTFHAPMLLTLSYERQPWVYDSFFNLLAGDATAPSGAKKAVSLVDGNASGVVIGGCLCLLCDSIGTKYPLETEGKILIIEDVDENPHRVDALLTHLRNIGLLKKAAGLVFGEFTGSNETSDPKIGEWKWQDIVADRVGDLGVPTVIDFPFGHMKTMLSLPIGIQATLNTKSGTLVYTESPCRT